MMPLLDRYFRILAIDRPVPAAPVVEGSTGVMPPNATFRVELVPDCDVYRGHFPHKPVSPGVCNIGMIRECAERLVGRRLLIASIKQCRLTAVASPQACPCLDVALTAEPAGDGSYTVTATLVAAETVYMTFKGTLMEK